MQQVERLAAYKDMHGDCHVPQCYTDDQTLGWWVDTVQQRRFKLTEKQKQTLKELGFAWNIDEINESERQQMVLEVRSIVYLPSLSHNNTNVFY
jgi:hypothetical protein